MINLDALLSAIQARKVLAEAATKAKPGVWQALTTHDGFEWTGQSHIRAEETTDDRRTSRPVAFLIADDLVLVPTTFTQPDPEPAFVARFIAANSPAVVLRQCEADLAILELVRETLAHASRFTDYDGEDGILAGNILRRLAHAYAIPTEDET